MKLAVNGGSPVRFPRKPWPAWPPVTDRAVELVTEVIRSGNWAFNGPKEWEFADRFASFSNSKYGLVVANGTVAIQLALEALDIGAYDEVIVPGLTWQATAAACLDVNAIPILVDIDPETYCLDVAKAEAAITPKTRAIIVVHLYGAMADMDAITALARKHELRLIEDCAHQHGSRWDDHGVGTLGDVGCFSLQSSKVLTSGEGGINLTQDWDLFLKLASLRNCGRPFVEGAPTRQSGNYRITDLQAALLLAQMEQLEEQVILRDENAQYLNNRLGEIPGITPMKRHAKITRQSCYMYSFRYNSMEWDDIPANAFRQALSAELGCTVLTTYEPLNDCSLYKPHTKHRHYLSDEYWAAIDPTRFELPVCRKAYKNEAVILPHQYLLGNRSNMDEITTAVEKLYTNRAEMQGWWKQES